MGIPWRIPEALGLALLVYQLWNIVFYRLETGTEIEMMMVVEKNGGQDAGE